MRKMFSQNQIKNIVNEGIEAGEINAGTKLYKHYVDIVCEDALSNEYEFYIEFTSSKKETLNIDSAFSSNDIEFISFSRCEELNSNPDLYTIQFMQINGGELLLRGLQNDFQTLSLKDITATISSVDDQVTPL